MFRNVKGGSKAFRTCFVIRVPYLKRKKRNPNKITLLSLCPSVCTSRSPKTMKFVKFIQGKISKLYICNEIIKKRDIQYFLWGWNFKLKLPSSNMVSVGKDLMCTIAHCKISFVYFSQRIISYLFGKYCAISFLNYLYAPTYGTLRASPTRTYPVFFTNTRNVQSLQVPIRGL